MTQDERIRALYQTINRLTRRNNALFSYLYKVLGPDQSFEIWDGFDKEQREIENAIQTGNSNIMSDNSGFPGEDPLESLDRRSDPSMLD